jgi:hypothetical protein
MNLGAKAAGARGHAGMSRLIEADVVVALTAERRMARRGFTT